MRPDMKKIMMALSILLLLLFAVSAAADDGLDVEVVNKTGKELTVELEIHVFGEKRVLTRVVAKGGTVRFHKSETAHKEGALMPYWDIIFNKSCKYKILSEDGECPVMTGTGSCAMPSKLGPCGIKFTVAN